MKVFASTPTWNIRKLPLFTRQLGDSIRVHAATANSDSLASIINGPPVWDSVATPIVAAYIHLPFCKRRCHYCDFPVVTTGDPDRQVVQDRFNHYVDQLCQEIQKQSRWNTEPLQTLYFGGGTPSLIPANHLSRIIETVQSCLGISPAAEITMEADPGTFDAQQLKAYMHTGVNRFSVGVQAFSQKSLELCGRSHNQSDVYDAIRAVRDAAPRSWSLDLISGLPGVSLQDWEESVHQAICAQPCHISIYDLQVEQGTAFQRWQEQGALRMPSEVTAVDSWRRSCDLLSFAGYEHYELSNFAKPGHKCAHNMVYWKGYSYYAFGLGAASYQNGLRSVRPRSMKAWQQYVQDLEPSTDMPSIDDMRPDMMKEKMLEAIMLQLRLVSGINCSWFAQGFGRCRLKHTLTALERHMLAGRVAFEVANAPATLKQVMAAVDMQSDANVRLTDPDGMLLSNDIISDVFVALEE